MELRLRVHTGARPDLRSDRDLGDHLVDTVRKAFPRAPSAAVAVRPDRIEFIPLHPLIEQSRSPLHFLAGLTTTGVEAVGLVGAFRYRPAREAPFSPIAMVFVEWTDCRWWQWRSLVADNALVPDTDTFGAAVDGDPKPGGLGGWWSFARRTGLVLQHRPIGESPLVH
jgi:hypothetical protein